VDLLANTVREATYDCLIHNTLEIIRAYKTFQAYLNFILSFLRRWMETAGLDG
jgi:hypothetical protein